MMATDSKLLASAAALANPQTPNALSPQPSAPTEPSATTDTTATTPDNTITCIKYEAAVSEGKEILARSKRDQLRLGELAANVETKYGDRTLANFAKELGISPCTLERHRSAYLAWQKPAARPVSYAVMPALQDHPNRYDIVVENPKLTEAEARKLMRPHKDVKDAECGKNGKAIANFRWRYVRRVL
jgi:hypothetical protein